MLVISEAVAMVAVIGLMIGRVKVIKRFFLWSLTADNPQGRSEDFEFSAQARALGYKIFCDTGLQLIHEGQSKIDIRGIAPKI